MGLCNGTRLIVRDMRSHVIQAQVLTGSKKGKIVFIPRIDIESNEDGLPFTLKRRQFPIRPAFCMTVNKSQGQTFKKIGLFLEDPLYSHGKAYKLSCPSNYYYINLYRYVVCRAIKIY